MTSAAEFTGDALAAQRRLEQLKAVLQGMGDGLALQDENNRLLIINDAALRMIGLGSEAQARAALDQLAKLAHPAGATPSGFGFRVVDREGNEVPFQQWPFSRACRHEPFENLEVAVTNVATGHSWIGRFNGVRIQGEPGTAGWFVTTMQDVTERRQAEQALRDSESRFRRLSESGIVGIAFFDLDGAVYDANEKFLTMVGYSREEMQRGRVRWDQLTPPEWMPRTREAIEEFERTGRITPYEKEYSRRDGKRFWGLFGGARLDGLQGGIAFALDITDRKLTKEALDRSENRFRRAFEYAPIGMVLSDLEGHFLYVNRAYCSLVGYEPHELLDPSFDFTRLTHRDDRPASKTAMDRLLTGEIPAFFLEKRYMRKDGETVWVRVSATLHRDEQDRPGQIVALIEDITQRKRTEQALIETDRRKDDFLAALGHELRNPLAPIRNAMQILRMQGDRDPQVHWAAEVTDRQVQQMTRLVDDLLDVSRINRGKLALRCDALDLRDVIRRAVEMTAPLIERSRHQVDVRVPTDMAVVVRGDAARLTQVLANLLNNAAKFTPSGGWIQVVLEASPEHALIRIKDNGIGIPSGNLRDIFEPFHQVHAPAGQDQAGLGLGLALVKRLIELHGGGIEAASAGTGKGSEFHVRLPRVSAAVAKARRVNRRPTTKPEELRVLVVDDNRDVAESLAALLQILGHQAHSVYTGAGAIEAVEKLKPDVVFCDIGLPDLSGHEVAARLRQQRRAGLRLIALTGFARDSDKALRAGFDEWFLKPIEVGEIRSVLERSRRKSPAPSPNVN